VVRAGVLVNLLYDFLDRRAVDLRGLPGELVAFRLVAFGILTECLFGEIARRLVLGLFRHVVLQSWQEQDARVSALVSCLPKLDVPA